MEEKAKLLKEYFEAKQTVDAAIAVLDEKKKEIAELLKKAPEHKMRIPEASFTLRVYTTYVYSPDTQEMEKKLKLTKKIEETKGIAQIRSETYSPVMRVSKKEGGDK